MNITRTQVVEQFGKIDRSLINPNFEEGDCVYTYEGGEHCVAGEVLSRLGAPLPALQDVENGWGVRLLNGLGFELDAGALALLEAAQDQADDGNTWGDAIDHALEMEGV